MTCTLAPVVSFQKKIVAGEGWETEGTGTLGVKGVGTVRETGEESAGRGIIFHAR